MFERLGPVEHQQLADRLDRRAPELLAQALGDGIACGTIVAKHAHLDQAVCVERARRLGDHGVGEPGVADPHDGVQEVGTGTQGLAVGPRQRQAGRGEGRGAGRSGLFGHGEL